MTTILVVEDNASHLRLAVALLERAGYAVLEASDAESGLRLARAQLPALVLMDIVLPGMSGLEALQQLRRDEHTRAIPVIVLTSFMAEHSEAEALAAGAAALVAKPYHYRTLLATIADVLARCAQAPSPQ